MLTRGLLFSVVLGGCESIYHPWIPDSFVFSFLPERRMKRIEWRPIQLLISIGIAKAIETFLGHKLNGY